MSSRLGAASAVVDSVIHVVVVVICFRRRRKQYVITYVESLRPDQFYTTGRVF